MLIDSCSAGRLIFAILAVAAAGFAQAEEFFRYKNEQGVQVIGHTIPPQFVPNGYSIVNEHGLVIKVIEPAPTAADLESRAAARKEWEEQERIRKQDELLVSRYSSVEDIVASQNRVLDEIDVRLSILRGNLRTLKSQIEKQRERAANLERLGRTVPTNVTENIATMQLEVDDTRASIKQRKAEKQLVVSQFELDIKRFKFLQERRYGKPKS
ncbi:MAG: hypothetical protein ACR2P1_19935 [Pseudomonadales bacterium]